MILKSRPQAGPWQAFALTAAMIFVLSPAGPLVKALTQPLAPAPAKTNAVVSAAAGQPPIAAQPVPAQLPEASAPAVPAPKVSIVKSDEVSTKLRRQAGEKATLRGQLAATPTIGGALPGYEVDQQQPALAGPISQGELELSADAVHAFAYVQPYMEPDDYAYRNYCGPGAATALLSHWDAGYAKTVDIDQLGQAMSINPDGGVWIKDMVQPVNDELNRIAGREVNWYRFGEAQSLDEFRYMIDIDIVQNGVPLITALQSGDVPSWQGYDVGHIVAVYGYQRDADGTEWVLYADTASPASGYGGPTFNMVQLQAFWGAVSQNSAQVW